MKKVYKIAILFLCGFIFLQGTTFHAQGVGDYECQKNNLGYCEIKPPSVINPPSITKPPLIPTEEESKTNNEEDITCFAETPEQQAECDKKMVEKAEKEEADRKEMERNTNLHPFVSGMLSGDKEVAEVEKESHMFQYFFDYISTPWYSARFFLNGVGKLIDMAVIGMPSFLASLFEAIKMLLTLLLLYMYKITSLSFLSGIFQKFLDVILDYIISGENIGMKILLSVGILSFVSWLVKNVQAIRIKNIVGMFLQLILVFIVSSTIITNVNTIINFSDKYVGMTVDAIVGKDDGKDMDTEIKEDIFAVMIQQPYLIRNFGYVSLESFQEADEENYMTRLEDVLEGEDRVYKDEIGKYKNATFVNNGGKALIGLLISVLSLVNDVILFCILSLFIILPLAIFNLILIIRPLSVIAKTVQAMANLKFGQILGLGTNLIVTFFTLGIARKIIGLFLKGYMDMLSSLYEINYYLVIVFDLFVLIVAVLLIKFKDMWLPLLKNYVKGTMQFAKTAMNGETSFGDAIDSGMQPIKAGIEATKNEWQNYQNSKTQEKNKKRAEDDLEKFGEESPFENGSSLDASWRAEQERLLKKKTIAEQQATAELEEQARIEAEEERQVSLEEEKESILKTFDDIENFDPDEIEHTENPLHKDILENIGAIDNFAEIDFTDNDKRTFGEIELEKIEAEKEQEIIKEKAIQKQKAKDEKMLLEHEAKMNYVNEKRKQNSNEFTDEEKRLASYDWISELGSDELVNIEDIFDEKGALK